jgi:hypothetical protein
MLKKKNNRGRVPTTNGIVGKIWFGDWGRTK